MGGDEFRLQNGKTVDQASKDLSRQSGGELVGEYDSESRGLLDSVHHSSPEGRQYLRCVSLLGTPHDNELRIAEVVRQRVEHLKLQHIKAMLPEVNIDSSRFADGRGE